MAVNVSEWLYPSYCEYSKTSGTRPVAVRRFVGLLDDLVKNQLKLDGVYRERANSGRSYFKGLRIRRDGHDDDLPSPITGRFLIPKNGDSEGSMMDSLRAKTIDNQESQGSEGISENSENILQNSSHPETLLSDKIEICPHAPESTSSKDLTSHYIPHTGSNLPSPASVFTKKTKTFDIGNRVVVVDTASIYRATRGVVIDIFYGRDSVGYLVKFDSLVRGVSQIEFEASDLMKV